MIMTGGLTGRPAGDDAGSLRLPAGRLNAVRKGNTRSKILIALLFAISIYLSDQSMITGPKKSQVRDDTSYKQR
jgi:hypothetical protein